MNAALPRLALEGVCKTFRRELDLAGRIAVRLGAKLREETVRAVDDVSFVVAQGEVVGVVGESGCGKSTLGRMIAGIMEPSAGTVLHEGRGFAGLAKDEARALKLRVQMIFQDPFASLNPRLRVRDIVGEAPVVHGLVAKGEIEGYVAALLRRVGLDASLAARYPHQFSGGQRQRIGIARALAVKPDMLVCDEAVAALDVSIQAQVINLFMDLRRDLGLTYVFISHDLGVVKHISQRVVVMYLGRVVEIAPTEALFDAPNHPYTRALLAEVPRLDTRKRAFAPVKGDIPSPIDPPSGCYFHPRCPQAVARCRTESPALREIAAGRLAACHLNDR
ncbi:MAG: ATP-binding cassette domain-containing protein [Alphaproteobacteria bacterium]|nr:ATP-binding cassette domain-containing protein [Alphaproteobacteria bacterium]